ncbi:MAG: prolipoprotein diacylglyceryl transferase [Deltaproteobacteria bacterium]|uniref:Prolipoprotein diacylglyceryl transferase n=1 Tax=Candidatus Zymogenus saltonus TaxID=2844893 RepID=A0A9D8KFW7_9DELT|nr:prolipoprotein diacylglyceryl transferase [Candidatus Zymogenus saltonus]
MHPDLLTIKGFTIHSYNFFVALGLLTGSLFFFYEVKRSGQDVWTGIDLYLWAVVGTFIGGKLLYILIDFRNIPRYFSSPGTILNTGSTMLGALLGALSAVVIYFRVKRLDPWLWSDLYAPSIPLAQAVARIGCLMAGCCYGIPTELPIGIVFTESRIAPLNAPLHPTQIYHMAFNLFIFLFLLLRRKRVAFRGELILSYVFLYVTARSLAGLFRAHPPTGGPFGATPTSLVIFAVVTIFAAVFYYRIRNGTGSESKKI